MKTPTATVLREAAQEAAAAIDALSSVIWYLLPLAEVGATVGDNKHVEEFKRKIAVAKECLERYGSPKIS